MSDDVLVTKETRDEAARWYAKLNSTTVTTEALRAFRDWRRVKENAIAYADIEDFWQRIEVLKNDADIKEAAEQALDPKKPASPLSGPGAKGLAIALLALGLAAAGAYGWRAINGVTYSTGVGEQRTLRLADGSKVQLDTDSKLRVRISGVERQIELARGQAFFSVARDASRPFVVEAGDTKIRALGTRFDVRRRAGDVQVVLTEGKVRVDGRKEGQPSAWILAPGDTITVGKKTPSPAIRRADVEAATSWTQGRLTFQDQPLASAIAEVNRYSSEKIVLTDPSQAKARVSGSFEAGDTEAFLTAITDLYGLRITARNPREIRLEPAA